jgi:hypothetical protein
MMQNLPFVKHPKNERFGKVKSMNIYRWNGTYFEPVQGALTTIVAGDVDFAVGINADIGNKAFYKVLGGGWRQIAGAVLTDISAAGSDVWGINRNDGDKIYHCQGSPTGSPIMRFDPVNGALVAIDGGGFGEVFGINAAQEPFRWDGIGFEPAGGKLTQIAVGGSEVWGINANHDPFRWNGHGWKPAGGKLTSISVDSGAVWGLNAESSIFRWNGLGWEPIAGKLVKISVGGGIGRWEAEVWGINADSDIFRWDGRGWVHVPGKLTQISVSKGRNPGRSDARKGVWGLH